MSRNYKFHNSEGLYFVSFAVVGWLDVFTRNEYKDLVLESLEFCQKNKGMEIHAWCIMTNHVHLIFRSIENQKPELLLGDFKRFTSRSVVKAIQENPKESRKEFLLDYFKKEAEKSSNTTNFQFWRHDNKPIELWSNEVIRGELQLSNLKLALQVVQNNQSILNKQLTVALGLDEGVKIIPDESIVTESLEILPLASYYGDLVNHPTIKQTEKAVDIYAVSEKISRSDMMPSLSAFAGNTLQRPITTSNPAMDMYTNGWSAGLSLNFNIDALFKAPKKIQLNRLEKEKAIRQSNEVSEMMKVAVNAAYIKYNEALTQNNTLKVNKDLTAENYRIMESKYNNQLAILLDLIDASNAKLDAELQFANSEINIVFAYYKLLKEAGTL